MKLLVIFAALFSVNSFALLNLEAEVGLSSVDLKGETKSSDGTSFRVGASLGLMPLIDFDFKYGYTSGESDDQIGNLNGEFKPQVEHDTHFFNTGVSTKLINWFRVGAGLAYQMSEHTTNSSVTSNVVRKDNDLGYYADFGLYHKLAVVGFSLTYTIQSAGDVDVKMYSAGVVFGI